MCNNLCVVSDMVRKYLDQNYRKLKRDHQRRGELFTDPRFPPDASSVFLSGQNDHDIVWKRPRVRNIARVPVIPVDTLLKIEQEPIVYIMNTAHASRV